MRHSRKSENGRIGYQVATARWAQEGTLLWWRFNAMLVANGFVATAIWNKQSAHALLALALGGFVLSFAWVRTTDRGFKRHAEWAIRARDLEKSFMQPVQCVTEGATESEKEVGNVRGFSHLAIAPFVLLYAVRGVTAAAFLAGGSLNPNFWGIEAGRRLFQL